MRRSIMTAGLTAALLVGGLMTPALAEETTPTPGPDPAVESAEPAVPAVEEDGSSDPTTEPSTQPSTEPSSEPTGSQEPTSEAAIDLVASTVDEGGLLTVSGTGFEPGETISLVLHSDPVDMGTTTADADGAFSFTWTVPAGTEGEHTVVATGATSGTVREASVTITAASEPIISPTPSPTPSINVGDEGIIGGTKQFTDDAAITGIVRNGCVITFTVQINTAGTYSIEIWDDGENIATPTVTGEAGSTQSVDYTMSANVGTQAWGYDFLVLTSDGTEVQWIDWDFEGSEQVMTQCAAIAAGATASAAPTAQLAHTGAETAGLALGAMFLVTAGGVALQVARRRA